MIKPVMLGYQASAGVSPVEVAAGRRGLEEFAEVEGYCLAEVFVDSDRGSPCSALLAVIESARGRCGVRAVAVARASDLGPLRGMQNRVRVLVEREAGVPVLIADGGVC